MTNREDFLADRIDRRRETADARDQRTARQKTLEARADAFIACEIAELPETDRADYARFLAGSLRVQLVKLIDQPSAATILSREAYEASKGILPAKIARARAEQLFAANDRGPG
jgi:5'-deoxynucleotidase YfbR-like HD superfamily hydrolase